MRDNFKTVFSNMYKKKIILYSIILIAFLAVSISTATPIINGVKSNTERYFGQIMKELNEAFKEKAAEEKKHISLLLNMTEEIKELNEQVRGMQRKIENIAG